MTSKNTRTRTRKPAETPKVEATPTAPAKPAPANCGCGCGAPTVTAKARFLSGHDARHAGNLARLQIGGTDISEALAAPQMSDRLRKKVADIVAKDRTRKAAKAAAAEARKVAQAAYDKAMSEALKA